MSAIRFTAERRCNRESLQGLRDIACIALAAAAIFLLPHLTSLLQ